MLREKVLKTILEQDLISQGEGVLVGLSGGPDSLALIHILHSLKNRLGIKLFACHLNHNIRGAAADEDQEFVSSFCRKIGVPLMVETFDVPSFARQNKLSLEDAGRKARYAFFDRVMKKFGAAKIALGHNADDNVETSLMRLITGSGARGLSGIAAKRGNIVRPLIMCWRNEIEAYCKLNGLHPRIDETNLDKKYLRNRIRHELIPLLKKYNPNVKSAISKATELLASDYKYLKDVATKALHGATIKLGGDQMLVDIDKLMMYPEPVAKLVIRLAVEAVKGDLENITFSHIEAIFSKLPDEKKWELHLPSGVFAMGDGDSLEISTVIPIPEEKIYFRYKLGIPGKLFLKEAGLRISAEKISDPSKLDLDLKNKNEALLDLGKLGSNVTVRSRLEGDKFSPLGIAGTKKLKDFFINEKVPPQKKDLVPIVEGKKGIAWVGGMRIDNRFKITGRTKEAVRLLLEPLNK